MPNPKKKYDYVKSDAGEQERERRFMNRLRERFAAEESEWMIGENESFTDEENSLPIKYRVPDTITLKELCDQFQIDVDVVWKMNSYQFGIETQGGDPGDYIIEGGTELMLPGNAVGVPEENVVVVDNQVPEVPLVQPPPINDIPAPFPHKGNGENKKPEIEHETQPIKPGSGDEPGTQGGIVSPNQKKKPLFLRWSSKVKSEGKGVIKTLPQEEKPVNNNQVPLQQSKPGLGPVPKPEPDRENLNFRGILDENRKEKALKIISDTQILYKDKYFMGDPPVVLILDPKQVKKKYWPYYAEYLLKYNVGKEVDGKLVPYTWEEHNIINKGEDGLFVVFGEKKKIETPVKQDVPTNPTGGTGVKNPTSQGPVEVEVFTTYDSEDAYSYITRYSGSPRTDIKPFTKLTEDQKVKYNWDATYKKFLDAPYHKGANPNTIAQWTRRALADGWTEPDPVPDMYAVYDVGIENGVRIIEAYYADDAFAHAYKMKNIDPSYNTFQWQRKLSQKRGYVQNPVMGSPEAGYNLMTYKDKRPEINFAKLLEIAGPDSQGLYDTIMAQPTYNDKIRQEAFVELTKQVQRQIAIETNTAIEETGKYDDALVQDYLLKKEQKKLADAETARKLSSLSEGIPVENSLFLKQFNIEGRPLIVDTYVLENLQKKCAYNYYEDIRNQLNNYQFGPTTERFKDLMYVLTSSERATVLIAYSKCTFLWEEEEQIVNQVLWNTPESQKINIKNFLAGYSYKYYYILKALCENPETRKDFYGATGMLGITVDDQKVMDSALQWSNQGDINTADNVMYKMSDQQINKFLWADRKSMLDNYMNDMGVMYADSLDELIINTPVSDHVSLRRYLLSDDAGHYSFDHLVRLEQQMSSSSWDNIQPYLDSFFAEDWNAWWVLDYHIRNPKDDNPTLDDLAYNVPKSVVAKLSTERKLAFIIELAKTSLDTYDEASVIKILETIGGTFAKSESPVEQIPVNGIDRDKYSFKKNPDAAKEKQEKNDFYNLLKASTINGKSLIEVLRDGFQGDNYTRLEELLGDMNPADSATQLSAVTTAPDDEKDDRIAQMGNVAMGGLSLKDREELILTICGLVKVNAPIAGQVNHKIGNQWWTQNVAYVLDRDEKSIIRLISTTPDAEIISLFDWMSGSEGVVYNIIDSRIHGAEFGELHDSLLNKAITLQVGAGDPYAVQKLKSDMEVQGLAHKNKEGEQDVLPWADHGILKQIAGRKTVYDYSIRFNSSGEVEAAYEIELPNNDENGLAWKSYKGATVAFKPYELIGVLFYADDEDLQAKKGDLRVMAAINLFELQNKQTKQHIMEAADVAAMIISVGALSGAVGTVKIFLACVDIALAAGGLIMSSYRKNMPNALYYAWQAANIALGGYFGLTMLVKGGVILTKQFVKAGSTAEELLAAAANADLKIAALKAELLNTADPEIVAAINAEIKRFEAQAQLLRDIAKMPLEEINDFRKAIEENPHLTPEAKAALLNATDARYTALTGKPKDVTTETPKTETPKGKVSTAGDITQTSKEVEWHFHRDFQRSAKGTEKEVATITYKNNKPYEFERIVGEKWKPVDPNTPLDEMGKKLLDDLNSSDDAATKMKQRVDGGGEAVPPITAKGLEGSMKTSYDQLVNSGLRAVEEGGAIKFYNFDNVLIAEISGGKLRFKYPGFGGDIIMDPNLTTTVLGKFNEFNSANPELGTHYFLGDTKYDMKGLPEGSFARGGQAKANPNGMNFLDLPDAEYKAILGKHIQKYLDQGASLDDAKKFGIADGNDEFWRDYNYPFLEDAFKRGDNVRLISDPNNMRTDTFGRELDAIDGPNGLAAKYNYYYDAASYTYKLK